MSLTELKEELKRKIDESEDEEYLSLLAENFDIKISLEEKESILKGIKDIEIGNFKSHGQVKKSYEKWL